MTTEPTPQLDPESLVARILAELQANPEAQPLLLRAMLTNEFRGVPAGLGRIEQDVAQLNGKAVERKDPEQLLDEAAALFEIGDVLCGARLAYEGAMQAVKAAAKRKGLACDTREDVWEMMYALDGIKKPGPGQWPDFDEDRPPLRHMGHYGVVESFQKHAKTPLHVQQDDPELYWQPDDYSMFLGPVRELVKMLADVKDDDENV